MLDLRSISALTLALLASLGTAACADDREAPPEPFGIYTPADEALRVSPEGFETMSFEPGRRYAGSRRACEGCERTTERGRYDVDGSDIVLIDDATGSAKRMPFSVPEPKAGGFVAQGSLVSRALTESGQSLVSGGGKQIVSSEVLLDGKQYALVTCGSGGICSHYPCASLGRPNAGSASDCGFTYFGKFVPSGAGYCCGTPGA
jgi:hypothetical protein